MAVWGVPTVQENDAERAVRAALELVDAVAAFGEEVGAPGLRARAGLLTGEVAVNLGASGEGMVAGDLVNTASRVQSAAEPGTVYVGDATRRATEAAIVYDDAGVHELKGKPEPERLWRARAGRRGGGRRAAADRARAAVRRARPRAPPAQGVPARDRRGADGAPALDRRPRRRRANRGSAWEFFKYVDGVTETDLVASRPVPRLRRGRRLLGAQRDGAHARRHRRERASGDRAREVARAPSRSSSSPARSGAGSNRGWRTSSVSRSAPPPIRATSTPRGASSSSAWPRSTSRCWSSRTCSGRTAGCSTSSSTCWSGRATRRSSSSRWPGPSWPSVAPGGGPASADSPSLLPRSAVARGDGSAARAAWSRACPTICSARILDRAAGVPLYAVETVRMLHRPRAARRAGRRLPRRGFARRARGAGDPARVDRRAARQHRRRRAAAAAGCGGRSASRSPRAGCAPSRNSAARSGGAVPARRLVNKDLLAIQSDPRSPERGQYVFVQDLVRSVAYGTLARRDRKLRHLAAATYLESSWSEEEERRRGRRVASCRGVRGRPRGARRAGTPAARPRCAGPRRRPRRVAGGRRRRHSTTS